MSRRRSRRPAVRGDGVPLTIDYCGEVLEVADDVTFTIGRDADLVIDDNPFLHRRFLRLRRERSMWTLANVGRLLAATVADGDGVVQAWLAPGARLPLVFDKSVVWFTAGPTTYEFAILQQEAPFSVAVPEIPATGPTTQGRTSLTPEQRLLLVALAEPMLRRRVRGAVNSPSSADAADRLGWTLTKFNRKLDNLCQKFERMGVRGLHGDQQRLASDRKARLVEYALATRLVDPRDLELIDAPRDG